MTLLENEERGKGKREEGSQPCRHLPATAFKKEVFPSLGPPSTRYSLPGCSTADTRSSTVSVRVFFLRHAEVRQPTATSPTVGKGFDPSATVTCHRTQPVTPLSALIYGETATRVWAMADSVRQQYLGRLPEPVPTL